VLQPALCTWNSRSPTISANATLWSRPSSPGAPRSPEQEHLGPSAALRANPSISPANRATGRPCAATSRQSSAGLRRPRTTQTTRIARSAAAGQDHHPSPTVILNLGGFRPDRRFRAGGQVADQTAPYAQMRWFWAQEDCSYAACKRLVRARTHAEALRQQAAARLSRSAVPLATLPGRWWKVAMGDLLRRAMHWPRP
jgi:hypothetical protein